VETSGIIGADGVFINIVRQIGSMDLLQRLIQVLGAVYINTLVFYRYPREAMTKLDTHMFQKGAFG
jgi:hypothetical protein